MAYRSPFLRLAARLIPEQVQAQHPAARRQAGSERVPLLYKIASEGRQKRSARVRDKDLALEGDVYRRFGEKVKVDEETGCWEWIGAKNKTGYGVVTVDGKRTSAHRIAWVLWHNEPIPSGKHICHTCDNRACVNPAHLFTGSHKDNMQDMSQKLKKSRGKTRDPDKLPKTEILEIRAASNRGLSFWEIAQKHKVTPSEVHVIVERTDWPWMQ